MLKSHVGDGFLRPPAYLDKTNSNGICAPARIGTSASRALTPRGHGQVMLLAKQPPCAPGDIDETIRSGFNTPVFVEPSASKDSTPRGHGQYQFFDKQPAYEEDDVDDYSRSAWARLRTPSPECFHRGIDSGSFLCSLPPLPDGGFAPIWSNGRASLRPLAPEPQREPASVQPSSIVDSPPADVKGSCNGLGKEVPPPPILVATSPVNQIGKMVKFIHDNRGEDAEDEDCTVMDIGEWSRGSHGHPHSCSGPCKYQRKKRGCRDGADCDHCHFCKWRPSVDRLLRRRAKSGSGL